MIEYKIDKQPTNTANAHIRDMQAVLKEISVTYQVLDEVLQQQQTALSSPSIDKFRRDLQAMIHQATRLAETITDHSQKLVAISDQASKHLVAIEDHFSAALEKHVAKV